MLVFVDLETGGLPEVNAADMPPILEVAVIVTDDDLNEVDSKEIVIHHTDEVLASMNEWCINQHGETGLTDASRESNVSLSDAETELIDWLTPYLKSAGKVDEETGELKLHRPPLCGSTVSFDRQFLRVHMPDLVRLFHYRNIDVSSFKEFFRVRDLPAFDTGDRKPLHRALDDIRFSIRELQHYKGAIEGTGAELEFKEGADPVFSSDPYYDLTMGGYIKPEELLSPEDAKRVRAAAKLLEEFFERAEDRGVLEIG